MQQTSSSQTSQQGTTFSVKSDSPPDTSSRLSAQDSDVIKRIRFAFSTNPKVSAFSAGLQVSIEGSRIVLQGQAPSDADRQTLILVIRQAGVLGQICNNVLVG